jgi:hypothetical protein
MILPLVLISSTRFPVVAYGDDATTFSGLCYIFEAVDAGGIEPSLRLADSRSTGVGNLTNICLASMLYLIYIFNVPKAERVRFGRTVVLPTEVFKTAALIHSAITPNSLVRTPLPDRLISVLSPAPLTEIFSFYDGVRRHSVEQSLPAVPIQGHACGLQASRDITRRKRHDSNVRGFHPIVF